MLMNELYEYEERAKKNSGGKISQSELDKIHKLTDTVKNICKIDMLDEEGGYSEDGHYMGEGRIYGTSYARGRGRNARRDSMGRYSRDDGMSYDGDSSYRGGSSYDEGMSYARGGNRGGRMGYSRDGAKEHLIEKAEEMYDMASDEKERRAIKHFIKQLEDD